jgi:hypothetical protein
MTRTSSPNEQANLTFEQRLIEYRRSLQWREDYDDFIDALDGRGGICAPDAASEYADEQEGLTDCAPDPLRDAYLLVAGRKRARRAA